MTSIEKAKQVIRGISTGDALFTSPFVSERCQSQSYIKEKKGREKCGIVFLHCFEDHNYAILHSTYGLDNKEERIDVFQFENGQIISHSQKLIRTFKGLPCECLEDTNSTYIESIEINKAVIRTFSKIVLIKRQFDELKLILNAAVNMQSKNDADELEKQWIEFLFKTDRVYKRIYQIFGDNNIVLAVSEGLIKGIPTNFFDLFKLKNRKIIAHWNSK
ncbi:MAG: hypothetical protein GQ574_05815 [Crocinitomix sp.]|nr:hypothetical protein [Crocinitomix sp.]